MRRSRSRTKAGAIVMTCVILAIFFAGANRTMDVDANTEGYSMTMDNKVVILDEYDATVTYTAKNATDWFGIYERGATPGAGSNGTALYWVNVPSVGEGTIKLNQIIGFAGANPQGEGFWTGEFDLNLCMNGGYELAVPTIQFTIREAGEELEYFISMEKTVLQGEMDSLTNTFPDDTTITYTAKNATDWIGVHPRGVTPGPNPNHALCWLYVETLGEAGTYQLSDIVGKDGEIDVYGSIRGLGIGSYDLNLLTNDSYNVAAKIEFTITAAGEEVDLTIEAPAVEAPYSFWVISDVHVQENGGSDFDRVLKDVKGEGSDNAGIFIVGDLTENGKQAEYDKYNAVIDANSDGLAPIYAGIGNHDFWTGSYKEATERFIANTSMPGLYYEVLMGDTTFLMLGGQAFTGGNQKNIIDLYDDQLDWLESRLEENAGANRPSFVFLHQGLPETVAGTLAGTVAGSWAGVVRGAERLRSLLNAYPNVQFFSGHSHWVLEHPNTMFVDDGGARMFNTASTSYLWNDNNDQIAGSQGYKIEVYEDYMKVRGRNFVTSTWIESAQFTFAVGDHDHDFDNWTKKDTATHERKCVCGEVESEAHSYGNGVITAPTYTQDGFTTYSCTACAHSYTDFAVSKLTFTVKVSTDSDVASNFFNGYILGAALAMPVRNNYVFVGWFTDAARTESITAVTAPDLDGNGNITLYAKWSQHTHSFDDWAEKDAETHTRTCGCGEIESAAHSYGSGVVTAPTETKDGYTMYTCTACGHSYADAIVPKLESDPAGGCGNIAGRNGGYVLALMAIAGLFILASGRRTRHKDGDR